MNPFILPPELCNEPKASGQALLGAHLKVGQHVGMTFHGKGSFVVFDFAHPENHWHLADTFRVLLSCFPADGAIEGSEAAAIFLRHYGVAQTRDGVDSVLAMIVELVRTGVILVEDQQQGQYTPKMCSYYYRYRAVPQEICSKMIEEAVIERQTSVLDLGTGPGSIANYLGVVSENVLGADVSDAFLDMARCSARSLGSRAKYARLDGNTLLFSRTSYDVIVASQMFHWLDVRWAIRGLYHGLREGGSLFVGETKPLLKKQHPLKQFGGFGNVDLPAVIEDCVRHRSDYQMLFSRFCQQPFYLNLKGAWVFRQRRSFDIGFARAYFFDGAVRYALPGDRSPWRTLEAQLGALSATEMEGEMYWLLFHFKKERNNELRVSRHLEQTDIIDL